MNITMTALLAQLNHDSHQSGQDLANSLGVSRTMVWKAIKQLQERGIGIETQKGLGYRLLEKFEPLDAKEINKGLSDLPDIQVVILQEVDSTNDYLSTKSLKSANEILICLAEQQINGKGRQGRRWVSPYGANLYLSFRFRYVKALSTLYSLTPLLGLICVNALKQQKVENLQLKWPNDILLAGKKLGGILVEIRGEFNTACEVIIGIGMNVNMTQVKEEISQPWTSLKQHCGRYFDRNQIAASLITEVVGGIRSFNPSLLSQKLEAWNKIDRYYGHSMTLNLGKEKVSGISRGIDKNGALPLGLGAGELKSYSVGEIENTDHD